MFVAFNNANSQWYKFHNTLGFYRLIAFNSTLKSVPNIFNNDFLNRCDCSGKLLPLDQIKVANRVKVFNGPFANCIATIETLNANQRISILMDLMSRQTKIKVICRY
jgi:transcriptional antiterminator RfaH